MMTLSGVKQDTRIMRGIVSSVLPNARTDTVIVALLGSPSRTDLWRESEILIGKGFDVLGSGEAPVIYLAKMEDTSVIKKASHAKKPRMKAKSSKSRQSEKFIAKKTGKQKNKVVLAKKKSKAKVYAKYKGNKNKNYGIAKRDGIAGNKG